MKKKEELINSIARIDELLERNKTIIEKFESEDYEIDSPLGKLICLSKMLMMKEVMLKRELLKNYDITLMTNF